jgi:hypothetical protein
LPSELPVNDAEISVENNLITIEEMTGLEDNAPVTVDKSIGIESINVEEHESTDLQEPRTELSASNETLKSEEVITDDKDGQDGTESSNSELTQVFRKIDDTLTKIFEVLASNQKNDGHGTRVHLDHAKELRFDRFDSIDPRIAAENFGNHILANEATPDYSSLDYSFDWFKAFVEDRGYCYAEHTLRLAHAQVMNSNSKLIVLAGPPGTGKTSLVRLLAEFFEHSSTRLNGTPNPRLKVIPVSPTWFSTSSLLGGYSEIDGKFRTTDFLDFALCADYVYDQRQDINRSEKFFVCLDEFNLAHPEQYLSSILSIIEFPYGTSGAEFTICKQDVFESNSKRGDLLLRIPPNLKVFATVNTDATSKALSPKVIDRSTYIRIIPQTKDVTEFLQEISKKTVTEYPILQSFFDEFLGDITIGDGPFPIVATLAAEGQSPIGYRAIKRMVELIVSHPFTRMAQTRNPSKLSEIEVKEMIGEVICSIFLSRLPGVFSVIGKEYSDRIEIELQSAKLDSLQAYPGVRRILTGLLNGYSGQSAI